MAPPSGGRRAAVDRAAKDIGQIAVSAICNFRFWAVFQSDSCSYLLVVRQFGGASRLACLHNSCCLTFPI